MKTTKYPVPPNPNTQAWNSSWPFSWRLLQRSTSLKHRMKLCGYLDRYPWFVVKKWLGNQWSCWKRSFPNLKRTLHLSNTISCVPNAIYSNQLPLFVPESLPMVLFTNDCQTSLTAQPTILRLTRGILVALINAPHLLHSGLRCPIHSRVDTRICPCATKSNPHFVVVKGWREQISRPKSFPFSTNICLF